MSRFACSLASFLPSFDERVNALFDWWVGFLGGVVSVDDRTISSAGWGSDEEGLDR